MQRKNAAAFILSCILCFYSPCAFAAGYQSDYIAEVRANLPSRDMDLANTTYFGSRYYAAKADGGLYFAQDGFDWQSAASFEHAYLIGDGRVESDKVVVLSGDTLYVSYNGVTFEPVRQFTENTVVHYIDGAYVAAVWDAPAHTGAAQGMVYLSADLKEWTPIGEEPVVSSGFEVRRHGGEYLISGLKTVSGREISAIVQGANCRILEYQSIRYDYVSRQYILKTASPSVSITMAYDPAHLPPPVLFDIPAGYAELYDDKLYYAPGGMADFDKAFLSRPVLEEQTTESNDMYFFYDSVEYDDGRVAEIWNRVSRIAGKPVLSCVIRHITDGAVQHETTVLGGYNVQRYGGVFLLSRPNADGGYDFCNMFSADGVRFHQVDMHTAYAASIMHARRGSYLFAGADSVFSYTSSPLEGLEKRGIEVLLNGSYIASDQPPILFNGSTMVPVRMIAEQLGVTVEWNGGENKVTLQKDGYTIELILNSSIAYQTDAAGGRSETTLDAPATMENGRILVPVRFVSESFGLTADWDAENRSVLLTY